VAVVGVNHAESTVGYGGDRPFPTTGKQGSCIPSGRRQRRSAGCWLPRPRPSTNS
jgi:hypothetical protein